MQKEQRLFILLKNRMNKILKKGLSVFLIILISTFVFYATPLSTYIGDAPYGVVVGGSVGSIAGFPGVMIGGTLGYFVFSSERVNAIAPIVIAMIVGGVIGGTIGGFKASGGTCNVYTAPEGGVRCDLCNDKLMPCSAYYCESLGQDCQYLKQEQKCIEVKSDDRSAPIVERCQAIDLGTKGKYDVESSNQGCKVAGEVPTFSTLAIKFDLDEISQCKVFSTPGKSFDSGTLLDAGYFDREHYFLFDIRNASLQTIERCREGDSCNGYIKCKDKAGNVMGADYFVNFKLKEAPDISKPLIVSTMVNSGAYLPANVNEVEFFMYVGDKTGVQQCRYSKNNDINFEDMPAENMFSCEREEDITQGGFRCSTTLKDITSGQENTYYFRCRDSSPRQNTMDQGFEFKLIGTEPLGITSNNIPSGEILTPAQKLVVSTSTASKCTYQLDSEEEKDFSSTNAVRSEVGVTYNVGGHTMTVLCTDEAGNQVSTSATFNVDTPALEITEITPRDTNVYTNLVPATVKTTGGVYGNGNSTCVYGTGIRFSKKVLSTETIHDANISLSEGIHSITITCNDGFKEDEETIRLEVNSRAFPVLTRVYTSGGALIIRMDQPSVCGFSTEIKEFNYESSQKMASSSDLQHQVTLDEGKTYYVKCMDKRTNRVSPSYTIIP